MQFIQAYILFANETCKHLGSQNAEKLNNVQICVLEGPEDNLLGRNMSPWHIYYYIQNKCCVNDWRVIFYLYVATLRFGKVKKKKEEILRSETCNNFTNKQIAFYNKYLCSLFCSWCLIFLNDAVIWFLKTNALTDCYMTISLFLIAQFSFQNSDWNILMASLHYALAPSPL